MKKPWFDDYLSDYPFAYLKNFGEYCTLFGEL